MTKMQQDLPKRFMNNLKSPLREMVISTAPIGVSFEEAVRLAEAHECSLKNTPRVTPPPNYYRPPRPCPAQRRTFWERFNNP